MIWTAAAILLILGAALLFLGLRGRSSNDHPICRRCRFDLVGLYPGRDACPECGSSLAAPKAVRAGQRSPRRRLAATGALVLLIGVVGAGFLGWSAATGFNWNSVKPTSLLISELARTNDATALAAAAELARRTTAGTLKREDAGRVAEQLIARQADLNASWNGAFGDLMEDVYMAGLIDPEPWNRYLRNGVEFTAALPRKARATGRLMLHGSVSSTRLGSRTGGTGLATLAYQLVEFEVDGTPLSADQTDVFAMVAEASFGRGQRGSTGTPLPSLQPGLRSVRTTWQLALLPPVPGGGTRVSHPKHTGWSADLATLPADARWTVQFDHDIEVAATDDPLVTLVDDDHVTAWLGQNITLRPIRLQPGNAMSVMVESPPPPIDIVARLTLLATIDGDSHRIPAGSVTLRRSATGPVGHGFSATWPAGVPLDRPITVDVLLEPDPEAADKQVDIERIWGGEVIIRGVEVVPPRPAVPIVPGP